MKDKQEYLCPACGKEMRVKFGSPVDSICDECKEEFLKSHEQDALDNCPFCGADREHLKLGLFVPYFYGMEGARVHCRKCGAAGGYGSIRQKTSWDCSTPPIFNRETIEAGFAEARQKWNRKSGNEWISVDERLPDDCGMPVLMVAVNGYGQTNVVKGFTDYACPIDFHTNEKEYYGTWKAWKVTHWMPIPEPPMMKGGEQT